MDEIGTAATAEYVDVRIKPRELAVLCSQLDGIALFEVAKLAQHAVLE
jgi:hypothetical protein